MLDHAGSLSSAFDVFRAVRKEMLWVATACFVALILSVLTKKFRASWVSYLFCSSVILALLALIVHYGLFLTTGMGINAEYLRNWIQNPSEVNRMIVSEVRPVHLALIFLQIGVVAFFALLPKMSLAQRMKEFFVAERKRKLVGLLALFFLFLEAGALLPPLDKVNASIDQMPILELIKGLLPEKEEPSLSVAIKPEERMDSPLEFDLDSARPRLNVVLIIFESLSWKYCDIYKPGLEATPFLRKLAERSLVVDRLYTVVPHTTKALIPILAGIYPYLEPAVVEALPHILPERSLVHILRRFGYRTAFFQTANHYEERPSVVANLGFDKFSSLFDQPQEGFADVNYFGKEEMMMLKPSLAWVEEDQKTPFFLTYLTLSTHHNYGTPPSFPTKHFGVDQPLQERYLNAVRYTDYFIERVFGEFEKRGLWANTILIIVGDHGESFKEHQLDGHNYVLWEEGLRVPGLIFAPKLFKEPKKITGLRSHLDIVPTVCDLLGLKIKEGQFIGTSLLQPVEEDRVLFYSGWSRQRVIGMREGQTKYLFWPQRNNYEIYDNLRDPEDKTDLSKTKPMPRFEWAFRQMNRWADVVKAQYGEWRQSVENDPDLVRPLSFVSQTKASLGSMLLLYGHELFPQMVQPGRSVWVRIGLRCESKIKRPMDILLLFKHESENVEKKQLVLSPRTSLEKLEPGMYTTAEHFLFVPEDWPPGEVDVLLALYDKKREENLIARSDDKNLLVEPGMVRLSRIQVMPVKGNQ